MIWRFIPLECQYWWIGCTVSLLQTVYDGTTVDKPTTTLSDMTEDIDKRNKRIQSYKLLKLAFVCNKQLIPTVMCLWGCSEFIQMCGRVPVYVMVYLSDILILTTPKCLPD